MPPKKRKGPPGKDVGKPSKKKKAGDGAATHTDEPEVPEKKQVRWILPQDRNDILLKEAFSPVLFQRPWDEVKNCKTQKFSSPQLPSPIHTESTEKTYEKTKTRRLRHHDVSQELQEFHESLWNENKNYIDKVKTDNGSVVSFKDSPEPIAFEGNLDAELSVSLRVPEPKKDDADAMVETTTSIGLIRRTSLNDPVPELFVVLPPRTSAIINGNSYENKASEDEENDDDVYIGPLGEFAIIEILHAPIFVWRNRKEMFSSRLASIPVKKKKHRKIPKDAEFTVTFTPPKADENDEPASGDGPENMEDLINPVLLAISGLQQDRYTGLSLEVEGTLLRPGQPWILPLRISEATVLVVIQYAEASRITIHVLDPRESSSNREVRDEIFAVASGWDVLQRWVPGLGLDRDDISTALPDSIQWVNSPAALDEIEAFSITILNAWTLAMGLSLNPNWPRFTNGDTTPSVDPAFSRTNFFLEAERLFKLSRSGLDLNWKSVYDFLKKHHFIVGSDEPSVNRRFDFTTIPPGTLQQKQVKNHQDYFNRLKSQRSAADRKDLLKTHRELTLRRAKAMSVPFPSSHHASPAKDLTSKKPSDPCLFLKNSVEQLLADNEVKKAISQLQPIDPVLGPSMEEVSQTIASVTLAITMMQTSPIEGYSFLSEESIRGYATGSPPEQGCINAGPPMLVPLDHGDHLVLLIAHAVDRGDVEILVMDPRPQSTINVRTGIYKAACRLIVESGWMNFSENPTALPENAIWIPCAGAGYGPEIGYHVIFDAWAVALGLRVNRSFDENLKDMGPFLLQSQNIIRLARIGRLSWRTIVAFLECHNFIEKDWVIPEQLRFDHTVSTSDNVQVQKSLDLIRAKQQRHMTTAKKDGETGQSNFEKFLRLKNVFSSEGKVHTSPWIGWTPRNQSLIDSLKLTSDKNLRFSDESKLRQISQMIAKKRAAVVDHIYASFLSQVDSKAVQEGPREHAVQLFHTFMQPWGKRKDQSESSSAQEDPCELWRRYKSYYVALDKGLKSGDDDDLKHELPKEEEFLEEEDVILGIAAVVESIDQRQSGIHNASVSDRVNPPPFAGGFSFASANKKPTGKYNNHTDFHIARPRRCWLLPFMANKASQHFFLAVLQEERKKENDQNHFVVYFMDSFVKGSNQSGRTTAFQSIKTISQELGWSMQRNSNMKGSKTMIEFASTARSIPIAQELEDWTSGYHAILNAWILALGLHPNPNIALEDSHYTELRDLINHAMGGFLTWEVLVSWLICRRLITERNIDAVHDDRRFSGTISQTSSDDLQNRIERILLNDDQRLQKREFLNQQYVYNNNIDFSSVTWTDCTDAPRADADSDNEKAKKEAERRKIEIEKAKKESEKKTEIERKKTEIERKKTEVEKAKTEVEKAKTERKKSNDSCQTFFKELNPLVKTHGKRIEGMKKAMNNSSLRGALGTLLLVEDVGKSIASVIWAITQKQSVHEGFSCIAPSLIGALSQHIDGDPIEEDSIDKVMEFVSNPVPKQAIRFSRPMIIAPLIHNHTVLMVVQYDEEQKIKLTVLDSRPWHMSKDDRRKLPRIASKLVKEYTWRDQDYHRHYRGDDSSLSHAGWAPCAIQTTSYTCGYHVIFNAWAIALGLKLDPGFQAEWNLNFLDNAQNLICLALLGLASSELIHNYLECIKFVFPEQTIDASKKFERTHQAENEEELAKTLLTFEKEDQEHWGKFKGDERDQELDKIRQTNRVCFSEGVIRLHDANWPSDDWHSLSLPFLDDVTQARQLTSDVVNMDRFQLTYNLRMYSDGFNDSDMGRRSRPQNVMDGFQKYRTAVGKVKKLSTIQMFHDYIQMNTLNPSFVQSNPVKVSRQHCEYLSILLSSEAKILGGKVLKVKVDYLDWEQVNLGIIAVIQALDKEQATKAERKEQPFAGGFALATDTDMQIGLVGVHTTLPAARPRRCWLIPYLYHSGDIRTIGHFFLVVVQEEAMEGGGTQFCVYFLDSRPSLWNKDSMDAKRLKIFKDIQTMAQTLRWTKHRNANDQIKFRLKPKYVRVAQQLDDVTCGHHTILNAWILALGLTPNVQPRTGSGTTFISNLCQLINIALAGLLDWKTLVAWLLEHDLTVEKSINSTTLLDRTFEATVAQTDSNPLATYIEETQSNCDTILETVTEHEQPYNRNNNVNFKNGNWKLEQGGGEPRDLTREAEDSDDVQALFGVDGWFQFFEDLVQSASEDRRRAAWRARRRKRRQQVSVGEKMSAIRK